MPSTAPGTLFRVSLHSNFQNQFPLLGKIKITFIFSPILSNLAFTFITNTDHKLPVVLLTCHLQESKINLHYTAVVEHILKYN